MKITSALILLLCLLMSCDKATSPINFGSNNGSVVNINGKNIYYEEYGQGIPLLLLSGGGINRSIKDFSGCIPELSKQYRVIAPDTPGQGRSDETDTLSYQLLTNLMSTFINSLKLDSCYIMGWSDGAITGLLLAAQHPNQVRKVIAVGANNGLKGFVTPEGFPLDSIRPPTLEYWASQNEKDIKWYNSLTPKKDWKKVVSNMNEMVYQKEYFPSDVYHSISIPVMIVLGDQDMITVEHGLEMHRLISNSQFCVLPNTTHEVFAERADVINKISIDFFD